MNSALFFTQVLVIVSYVLVSLRLGKGALVAAYSILVLLANLFVLKQVNLFGLEATAADAYTIGAFLSLTLIQDYFGAKEANRCVSITFFLLIFLVLASQLHVAFVPSQYDAMQPAYQALLTPSLRVLVASILVAVSMHKLTIYLNGKMPVKSWLMRSGIILLAVQFLDTVLFSYAGLYGVLEELWQIILFSYIIKVIAIFGMTPLVAMSKRIVRHV